MLVAFTVKETSVSQILQHQTAASMGAVVTISGDGGVSVSPDGVGNINIQSAVGSGLTATSDALNNEIILNSTGPNRLAIRNIDEGESPYEVLPNEVYISCDILGGTLTIKLPNEPDTGRFYIIKDATGFCSTNNITVTTVGGVVLIDAAATNVMNSDYQSVNVVFNGVSYEIW